MYSFSQPGRSKISEEQGEALVLVSLLRYSQYSILCELVPVCDYEVNKVMVREFSRANRVNAGRLQCLVMPIVSCFFFTTHTLASSDPRSYNQTVEEMMTQTIRLARWRLPQCICNVGILVRILSIQHCKVRMVAVSDSE